MAVRRPRDPPVGRCGGAVGVALPTIAAIAAIASGAPAQETTFIGSLDSGGVQRSFGSDGASLSSDGQSIAFVSGSQKSAGNVFVHDLATGLTECCDVDSSGHPVGSWSDGVCISDDGQFVVFWSNSPDLVAGDTNDRTDVFVRDRNSGTTERVSVDSSGTEGEYGGGGLDQGDPAISADGRFVAFTSYSTNLVAGDTNDTFDVFVHDRSTGITERVSVDSSGAEANDTSGRSNGPSISGDGRYVVFESHATNLVAGDTNGATDVFLHDRTTGVTERVSVSSAGTEADSGSYYPSISADGACMAFTSWASNLVAGDTNLAPDVFVHDRSTGVTERVSVDSAGVEANGSFNYDGASGPRRIAADGRLVVFQSDATNLVPGDTNDIPDVFVHDRAGGTTRRINIDSAGAPSLSMSWSPTIAAGGLSAAFSSSDATLVAGDTNQSNDVFVHAWHAASSANYGSGLAGTQGVPAFTSRAAPVLGATVTLDLANSYALPTIGVLFIGPQRAAMASSFGDDLLVNPTTVVPITFSYGGDWFSDVLPDDLSLSGVAMDLQAIELDPGALKGVSFTAGLELVLGR